MSTFITEMYSINRSYYRLLTLEVDIILTNNQQILNLFNFCCMKLSLIAFTGMRDSTLTILFVLNSLLPARRHVTRMYDLQFQKCVTKWCISRFHSLLQQQTFFLLWSILVRCSTQSMHIIWTWWRAIPEYERRTRRCEMSKHILYIKFSCCVIIYIDHVHYYFNQDLINFK